jgi:hypothetical protein
MASLYPARSLTMPALVGLMLLRCVHLDKTRAAIGGGREFLRPKKIGVAAKLTGPSPVKELAVAADESVESAHDAIADGVEVLSRYQGILTAFAVRIDSFAASRISITPTFISADNGFSIGLSLRMRSAK